MSAPSCRFSGMPLDYTFADLGSSPLANSYLNAEQLHQPEHRYPLQALVCEKSLLVQVEQFEPPERIFSEYAYFSSYSGTWVEHARVYSERMIDWLALSNRHQVIEIASNDGYLLQNFIRQRIPALGIEPARNVAEEAIEKGIPTIVRFFGADLATELASEGIRADLLIGNNVLAHVPDLKDFVEGLRIILKPDGLLTMEFPHLLRLIEGNQFDTIYHEHFSYFSLLSAEKVFAAHGLTIFDVEELDTHGGSLRIFVAHSSSAREPSRGVYNLKKREVAAGLLSMDTYCSFGERIKKTKDALLEFLHAARHRARAVVAYGAPAKGNTLLNYCGVGTDLIEYTVDRNPHKQGLYLPGSHIPIFNPRKIFETRPDYVLILPWNLKAEVVSQMAGIHSWGGKFVIPIPNLEVIE